MLPGTMDIDLTEYTEAELLDLHRRVVARIEELRALRQRTTMAAFRVGMRVSFRPEHGHVVAGTIIRLNRRSVTIAASDGTRWRVAPILLEAIADEFEAPGPQQPPLDPAQARLFALAERQERDRGKA
jgi:hypothetical protein